MALSREQIQEIIQSKPRKNQLTKAEAHESRLKFHGVSYLSKTDLPRYAYREFLSWVGGTGSDEEAHPTLLPEDKFKRFKQLLQAPIATVDLAESMYTKLHRIFKAEDAHREYDGNTDLIKDFLERYDLKHYWGTKGFEAMITAINSVWVADMPGEESEEYPEPYGYLVPIGNVIDIQNNDNNDCIYVIFTVGDSIMIYDRESVQKYSYRDRVLGNEPEAEFEHGLDYTPARQMWTDKLETDDLINKKSPLSNVLSWMDYYLFMLVNQRYMELGNSYPITAVYMEEGNVDDSKPKGDNVPPSIKKPKGSDLVGPGSIINVPPPLRADEPDLMANPVQVISPDVEGLEYHVNRMVAMREAIFVSVVGQDENLKNDQAKNELQVSSSFESQMDVLIRVQKNFEIIEKFSAETLFKLRYEEEMVATIDYGTKHFMRSLSQLEEDYNDALKSGADPVILESIKDSIIAFKYQNNPSGLARAKIVNALTPYRDKTSDELMKLSDKNMLDEEMLFTRMNILDLIGRFEREHAPLNVFGSEMGYNKRVETIRGVIKEYTDEILTKAKSNGKD